MTTSPVDAVLRALRGRGAVVDDRKEGALFAPVRSTAAFSPDRRYRYALTRTWGDGSTVVFIMLNPSTADAFKVDPTVARCIEFARTWGHESLIVLNLFAWRSTDPKALYTVIPGFDPIGPLNDYAIDAVPKGTPIIAAWGVHGSLDGRGKAVRDRLDIARHDVYHLGDLTKEGHPRHPLYLKGDLMPRPVESMSEG